MSTMLEKVKAVCRVASTAFDEEIKDLIDAAFEDMGLTNINRDILNEDDAPALIIRAVSTYVKMNFGTVDESVYQRLKASYDEQKAQLAMSPDYNYRG